MEQVYPHLYVGNDADFLKLKEREGWSFLRCCKEGPGGHRDTLHYTTQAAPKGDNYLSAPDGSDHLALNFIDPHDPHFIPPEMVREAIAFIDARLAAGDRVLVACNQGHSRGPTTALLYLRSIGELPHNFIGSERVFRALYEKYDPSLGARQFARSRWDEFQGALRKDSHGR